MFGYQNEIPNLVSANVKSSVLPVRTEAAKELVHIFRQLSRQMPEVSC